jgi:type III secretion protein D
VSHLPVTHELRVHSREHADAPVVLSPGEPLTVGTGWDNDVVLSASGRSASLRLVLTLELAARGPRLRVQVLQGMVRAGGRCWAAGASLRLPPGRSLRWAEARLVFGSSGAVPVRAPAASSRRGPGVWLRRAVGTAVVATSLGMMTWASTVGSASTRPAWPAHQVHALLVARGYEGLTVQADAAGLVITGHLDTLVERSQLERILQAEGVQARLRLDINEQLVAAVHEVYRLHGVAAQVRAVGPGRVAVQTMHPDAATVARLQEVVRRDVAGLRELLADNHPPPRTPSPVPVVDDPGKRVAALVPGDPSHVVTADGTRYFEGSLLPTGHRIVAIAGSVVQLEREGQASFLEF